MSFLKNKLKELVGGTVGGTVGDAINEVILTVGNVKGFFTDVIKESSAFPAYDGFTAENIMGVYDQLNPNGFDRFRAGGNNTKTVRNRFISLSKEVKKHCQSIKNAFKKYSSDKDKIKVDELKKLFDENKDKLSPDEINAFNKKAEFPKASKYLASRLESILAGQEKVTKKLEDYLKKTENEVRNNKYLKDFFAAHKERKVFEDFTKEEINEINNGAQTTVVVTNKVVTDVRELEGELIPLLCSVDKSLKGEFEKILSSGKRDEICKNVKTRVEQIKECLAANNSYETSRLAMEEFFATKGIKIDPKVWEGKSNTKDLLKEVNKGNVLDKKAVKDFEALHSEYLKDKSALEKLEKKGDAYKKFLEENRGKIKKNYTKDTLSKISNTLKKYEKALDSAASKKTLEKAQSEIFKEVKEFIKSKNEIWKKVKAEILAVSVDAIKNANNEIKKCGEIFPELNIDKTSAENNRKTLEDFQKTCNENAVRNADTGSYVLQKDVEKIILEYPKLLSKYIAKRDKICKSCGEKIKESAQAAQYAITAFVATYCNNMHYGAEDMKGGKTFLDAVAKQAKNNDNSLPRGQITMSQAIVIAYAYFQKLIDTDYTKPLDVYKTSQDDLSKLAKLGKFIPSKK